MRSMRPGTRARWSLACAASLGLLASCSSDRDNLSNAEAPRFARLAASSVAPLRLVKVDSVVLGTAAEGVNEITDFHVHDGRYYVLDGMSNAVRVFDRTGRLLSTIGREGRGPGELSEPMALAFAGGRMYV